MKKLSLPFLTQLAVLALCIALPLTQAEAKPTQPAKPVVEQKERLVLMPLRLSEGDQQLLGAMETALVKGLQQKYEIFSGEQVAKKAREIFQKESRNLTHKECDETRCMQGIAEAFQAELLAVANITKQSDGYFISLSIQNIFDNKVVQSESVACKGCDAYAVVEKLKELVTPAAVTSVPANAASAPVANGPRPTTDTTEQGIIGNPNEPENALWTGVRDTNSVEDYQTYLSQYPNGKYTALAHSLIKKLQDAAADQAWQTVNKAGTETEYQTYLNKYPQSKYAALAKTKFDRLKGEREAREAKEAEQRALEKERAAKEAEAERKAQIEAQAKTLESLASNMVAIPKKDYAMGKYEVTQAEWKAVMGNNPSEFKSCGDNCPVEKVSWNDIQDFLQKLNALTGKRYRLPTEKEWGYACYGGAGGAFSNPDYCGGDDINAVAWHAENSGNKTHSVGQKQANGYGLYDMSGNVREWQQDWYDNSRQMDRVLRGGSWFDGRQGVLASYRNYVFPAYGNSASGFRLARTLP